MKLFHIIAGLLSLGAGGLAFYALKGGTLHRKSGMIFVYAMLVMAGSGAVLAILKAEKLNAVMGVLTIYLVTTALLTVRRRARVINWIDLGAMLVAVLVGGYEINLGFGALHSPTGKIDGLPPAPAFVFGTVALLAALGDLRMMLAGGLQGVQRIARHLWRMGAAMFIATGSFFLGQAKVFPEQVRIIPLLVIPVLAVLLTLLYWLVRVLILKRVPHRVS
ncbi:MAG: hypothetical protein A3H91_08080 [Gammaproteobacteria bacterium RIFCSPLOWO2_02_FULL_61_13]|nr:MAG: hypothetical protein A3H91_08080 [Gammaproteobacteria bacterium RIFCSPLOWO2_02_FULL_61_13]